MEQKLTLTLLILMLFSIVLFGISVFLTWRIVKHIGKKDLLILALSITNATGLLVRIVVYALEISMGMMGISISRFFANPTFECVVSDLPWYLFSIGDFINFAIWTNFVGITYFMNGNKT